MSSAKPQRRLLGRVFGAVTRQRVYRVGNALEVEEVDHYEVTRKRVFFDDVLLVTYHRVLGGLFVTICSLFVAFFGGFAIAFLVGDEMTGAMVMTLLAVPFAAAIVTRLILKVDVVTVFGKRSKAVMRFSFRKRRARNVFDEICGAVRAEQRRIASQNPPEEEPAAEVAPPAEEFQLPPVE